MMLLKENQLTLITGASRNGGWEGYWWHSGGGFNKGHTTYGGQGGGFIGTNPNGMDLETLITENSCVTRIVGGLIAGGASVAGAIRGVIGGSIAGKCFSSGNGGGGGAGASNAGGCSGDNCSW